MAFVENLLYLRLQWSQSAAEELVSLQQHFLWNDCETLEHGLNAAIM